MGKYKSLDEVKIRTANRPVSYSGADFNIWAYFPIASEELALGADAHQKFLDNTEFILPVPPDEREALGKKLYGSPEEYLAVERDLYERENKFNEVFDELRYKEKLRGLSNKFLGNSTIPLTSLQTITSSYASSLSAVEEVGSSMPVDHTRGQKTYAGTMVFTVFDKEPLANLLIHGLGKNFPGVDASSEYLSFDQMLPFNIVIQASSELPTKRGLPQMLSKIIVGVRFMTGGETISVDDFFLEQQHQYIARYISPWVTTIGYNAKGGIEEKLSELLSSPANRAER